MAKTSFATNDALTKKVWDENLFRDTVKMAYFTKFMGKNYTFLVHTKSELEKSKGDNVTFGIRMRLAGAGVTSGQTLEGNEEKLKTYNHSLSLERYRHATRDNGDLDRQRAMFEIDEEAEIALKEWGAEKIDTLCFDAINSAPTTIFYPVSGTFTKTGTVATATAAITATDKITPALITKSKIWALTGGNRANSTSGQTPLRPIMVNGKKYFVLLVHPDVMGDLKTDATFAQARREALERGKDNPIFSGSEAVWDGVIVHEHEEMPIATNWGAGGTVAGAKCVLMGAQSLVWAWGKKPKVVYEKFDYGEEHGFGWGMTAAVNKPNFNSKDYGSVALYVARTKVSDI